MLDAHPDGYLATPHAGKDLAVLAIHAWWGLNDTLRDFCNRLAESGYVAFSPDLYHGKVAGNIADAEILSSSLDNNQAKADGEEAAVFQLSNGKISGIYLPQER